MTHWSERKHHSGETIAIGGLPPAVPDHVVIEGYVFEDCTILGPAVLVFVGEQTRWDAPHFVTSSEDALFWELPPREFVKPAGAVAISGCVFRRCRFERITLAASADDLAQMRLALIPPTELPH